MSVPYAIVDHNGMVAAIVPEHIVAEVMTSALVPNMGYRMECRPATEEEIFQLIYQLEKSKPVPQEKAMRFQTVVVGHSAVSYLPMRLTKDPA